VTGDELHRDNAVGPELHRDNAVGPNRRVATTGRVARLAFDEIFVRSNRPVAVPRPGLKLAHRWPLARASALSTGDDLLREVRAALDEALAAFGARPNDAS
jgi:hypothetical protein